MAKRRYINTKFWSDNFIVELNPLDRYFFLYLLTNEKTDICGIYELPLRTMAYESGIEKDMLDKMFARLTGKIYYIDGWVYIRNFSKHQSDNESVRIGIERSLKIIPEEIMAKIKEITDSDTVCTTLYPESDVPRLVPVPKLVPKPSVVAKSDEVKVFDFEEELEKMRSGTRNDFKVIALYWKRKGWRFANQKQLNSALKRELKAAKALAGYTGQEVGKAIRFCIDKYAPEMWTLETVHKRITDIANK